MTVTTWKRYLVMAGLAISLPLAGWTAIAQAHSGHPHDPTRVDEGQVVSSTLFVSGRELQMAGEIEGDYICAGQNVTISGRVQGDVICAAQNIRLTGTVDGDVRLAGQTVSVSGSTGGSLSVAAQSLQLARSATVGRDVSLAVTDARLDGTVGRDIQAVADQLTIANTVGRNVRAQLDTLTLASGTRVAGAISYTSRNELQQNADAQVAGPVDRQQPQAQQAGGSSGWLGALWILVMLSLLLTSMLLVWAFPRQFRSLSDLAWRQPAFAVLVGFAVSVIMPAVLIVLALTVIGLPLALLAGLLWLLLLFLSGPTAAYLLGRLLLQNRYRPWQLMLAGGVLLVVLYSVPVLNAIVMSVVVWIGSGTILLAILERVRMKPQAKAVKTTKTKE